MIETHAEMRKEIGKIAAAHVKSGAEITDKAVTIDNLISHVLDEIKPLTRIHVIYHDAQQAVKDRVTIARCRNERHGRTVLAFWWPRGERRLTDTRCPVCGGYLDQTSLALRAAFIRYREGEK